MKNFILNLKPSTPTNVSQYVVFAIHLDKLLLLPWRGKFWFLGLYNIEPESKIEVVQTSSPKNYYFDSLISFLNRVNSAPLVCKISIFVAKTGTESKRNQRPKRWLFWFSDTMPFEIPNLVERSILLYTLAWQISFVLCVLGGRLHDFLAEGPKNCQSDDAQSGVRK